METTEFVTSSQLAEKYGGMEALYEKMLNGGIEPSDAIDVWNKCAGIEFRNWVLRLPGSEPGSPADGISSRFQRVMLAASRDRVDDDSLTHHLIWLFSLDLKED